MLYSLQALNYVYYFQPDHVLSKLNEWLVDPGVHDALAANRIAQFESLFHMSPEEMDEHSAHEQASKTLFGNTMDLDDEIEELLMFHCLHDDDCDDIDLHLYEMHVNDDDGVPLATPKMLRVDAQQLVCLRGVERKHRAEYIKAVSKELTGLLQLGTFAICRDGECDDLKPPGSKFVLKIKYLERKRRRVNPSYETQK